MVEDRKEVYGGSASIAFPTSERAFSVLSNGENLQFVEWEMGRQKSIFGSKQPMKFLRRDDDDKNMVYVWTQRLPRNTPDAFLEIDGNRMTVEKYTDREIAAFDITKKQFVRRFTTRFVSMDARLIDVEPKRGLILGTKSRDDQFAPIFLANGSTGKVEASVDTLMQYVNDGVCLPQGLFVVGGHRPLTGNLEIVELKSGTTVKHLENQSLQSLGSCEGINYLITKEIFPKSDNLHFWRLENGTCFASVTHAGLQRVQVSPSEESVVSISGDAISVWSVQQLKEGFEKK
jgi:hypothetical protein